MDSLTSINMPVPVLISMTRHGAKLARQLTTTCDLSWHAKSGSFDEDHIMPDHVFDKTILHIQDSFAAGFPLIGICSTGILIRALAGQLIDKWTEPPVISIADD
ncbi:MAG: hypothetical protein ACPGYQ_05075, partial [Candidatus Puniceispirillales bacterium]